MYYSPSDATNAIKNRLKNGGQVVFISHAEKQMRKRHIDGQEVMSALRSGVVRTPGELKYSEYRYKVESNLNGGIAVAVEIPEDTPNLIIVTVFPLPKRKR